LIDIADIGPICPIEGVIDDQLVIGTHTAAKGVGVSGAAAALKNAVTVNIPVTLDRVTVRTDRIIERNS
jgi:hypothetical protein